MGRAVIERPWALTPSKLRDVLAALAAFTTRRRVGLDDLAGMFTTGQDQLVETVAALVDDGTIAWDTPAPSAMARELIYADLWAVHWPILEDALDDVPVRARDPDVWRRLHRDALLEAVTPVPRGMALAGLDLSLVHVTPPASPERAADDPAASRFEELCRLAGYLPRVEERHVDRLLWAAAEAEAAPTEVEYETLATWFCVEGEHLNTLQEILGAMVEAGTTRRLGKDRYAAATGPRAEGWTPARIYTKLRPDTPGDVFPGPAGVRDRCGIAKSAAHEHLQVLVAIRALENDDGTYRLTRQDPFATLALIVLELGHGVPALVQDVLDALAEQRVDWGWHTLTEARSRPFLRWAIDQGWLATAEGRTDTLVDALYPDDRVILSAHVPFLLARCTTCGHPWARDLLHLDPVDPNVDSLDAGDHQQWSAARHVDCAGHAATRPPLPRTPDDGWDVRFGAWEMQRQLRCPGCDLPLYQARFDDLRRHRPDSPFGALHEHLTWLERLVHETGDGAGLTPKAAEDPRELIDQALEAEDVDDRMQAWAGVAGFVRTADLRHPETRETWLAVIQRMAVPPPEEPVLNTWDRHALAENRIDRVEDALPDTLDRAPVPENDPSAPVVHATSKGGRGRFWHPWCAPNATRDDTPVMGE